MDTDKKNQIAQINSSSNQANPVYFRCQWLSQSGLVHTRCLKTFSIWKNKVNNFEADCLHPEKLFHIFHFVNQYLGLQKVQFFFIQNWHFCKSTQGSRYSTIIEDSGWDQTEDTILEKQTNQKIDKAIGYVLLHLMACE